MNGFVFSQKPIEIESGSGPYLTSTDGTEYLDMGASYAVASVGHSHPDVVAAVQQQAEELLFVQGSYPVAVRQALREKLAAIAPGDLEDVWLANSGTEANEAALKFARHATGRSKIVAANRAFHGRTMGSLAATWKGKYKQGFEPLAGDFVHVPYDDPEALAAAVDEETAAVILEPIQGEGGIRPASTEYLQTAREVTAETGAALVFDEIQTGLGRTGTMWAHETAGVVPDALTVAKGLGSGLPVSATVVADWIADDPGNHGSTFSGSPIVAAAAGATLDVIEAESLVENAASVGGYLQSRLAALDEPRDVRGEGLLVGIEVKRGANRHLKHLALDHQILALPAGRTVVRLLPPLVVDESHADETVDALAEVLA
ncbi:Ornithine/acetylornithine aminotransferase [Halanaeroarchaeum sp. HSR-CO]|uniref:aspartate aminotransferase family protein n=1 Tax=Halanaeroarchaeum sp. HSR-CO TaxID=2866382 RepID=UPI00217D8FE3|nr:aspartate aminotransferase family protein [Halanaeroarchaeum sp. HSR-CO]UWG49118.1 Ornithine/acetylornithine aminotransferase [Halanaeroarchaeum sp. HSR-CO]